jgi:hypothetical protein
MGSIESVLSSSIAAVFWRFVVAGTVMKVQQLQLNYCNVTNGTKVSSTRNSKNEFKLA